MSGAAAQAGERLKGPLAKAKGPAITGAVAVAGVVGGAVLGARSAAKPKKVLGIPVPGTGNSLAKQIGKSGKQAAKAGKQIGELTAEIRTARRKAEEVSKAIT